MILYEYKVVNLAMACVKYKSENSVKYMEDDLNGYAANGWELVAALDMATENYPTWPLFIFKREKTNA